MNDKGRELAIEQVVQFFFSEQWGALRTYCAERDVKLMGDVAVVRQTATVGKVICVVFIVTVSVYFIDRDGPITFILKMIFSP